MGPGVPGHEKVERLSSPHLSAVSDDRLKPPSIGGRNSDEIPVCCIRTKLSDSLCQE